MPLTSTPAARLRLSCAVVLTLAACGSTDPGANGGGGGKAGQGRGGGPQQVGYVVVQPTSVPLLTTLAGRTVAFQSSEVRPQVSGLIQKQYFTEGAIVHQGQPLYQIDASLYRAAASQAQANVASSEASAAASAAQAARYAPLAKIEAVSQQDYTNAVAQARVGRAGVQQARAALETARINLRFTTVPAPITGRIGRSSSTVGALVTSSQANPLTTIQQLDPIYVDIQQSSADLLALRRGLSDNSGLMPIRAQVRLQLEDGAEYPLTGSIEFSEVIVDQGTGTVTLRARFPNPQGVLLPGMFVRASFAQAVNNRAFLVPQQAVSRDPKGAATLYVVGPGDKALQRQVITERTQGASWVITSGLQSGDRVITQGLGRLKPNQSIRPVAANTAQRVAPAQGKGHGDAGQGGAGTRGGGQSGAGKGG